MAWRFSLGQLLAGFVQTNFGDMFKDILHSLGLWPQNVVLCQLNVDFVKARDDLMDLKDRKRMFLLLLPHTHAPSAVDSPRPHILIRNPRCPRACAKEAI